MDRARNHHGPGGNHYEQCRVLERVAVGCRDHRPAISDQARNPRSTSVISRIWVIDTHSSRVCASDGSPGP